MDDTDKQAELAESKQQWLEAGYQFLIVASLCALAALLGLSLGYILSKSAVVLDRLLSQGIMGWC
jgi:hypothetical protein